MTDVRSHLMVDIETLGTEPGCAIIEIAAVRFGPDSLGEEFDRSVDLSSMAQYDFNVDLQTLDWWGSQPVDSRPIWGGDDIKDVLSDFREFCEPTTEVWGYSHSFDCTIIEAAMDEVGVPVPWGHRDLNCARTVNNHCNPDWPERDVKHVAIMDARAQAEMVRRTILEATDD